MEGIDREKTQENQDFILLIMNCYRYSHKADQQRNTWLKAVPEQIKYYHVLGDSNLENEFSFDEKERKLIVKTPDDYNSLPKKVIAAYNAVVKTFEFKYIFKTDDDQELVQPKFLDILMGLLSKAKTKDLKAHYGGHIVDVPQSYLSKYYKIHPELPEYLPVYATKYCSGRFYFLSLEAIQNLIKQREKIENEYLEDYAIGFYLHPFFKEHMMKLQTDNFFTG
jgi:hypothetical protein